MKSNPIKLYQKGIVLFLFVLPVLTTAQTNASEPSGAGTSGDPYQISSLAHLSWLTQTSATWSSYFEQTANIDASETQYWDDADDNNDGDLYNDPNDLTSDGNNEGFSPIGISGAHFFGTYNGHGHNIEGLFIDRPTTDYVGFIGFSNGSSGTISELSISNCIITGKDWVGAFAGLSEHYIVGCYATGTVDGERYVGGLVGASYLDIENSFSRALVSGTEDVGGLVGFSFGSTENSYATGTVTGSSDVGGFVGYSFPIDGDETDCFWDTQTSGQSSDGGGAVGKTTSEMQQQTTFTNWDFGTVWKIDGTNNDGYPYLQWQQFDPVVTTVAVSDISQTTVTANGSLDNLGNPSATDHGFDIGLDANFDFKATYSLGAPSSTGNFSSAITDLPPNTEHFIRSWVSSGSGTIYGETVSFTTHIVPTSYTAPSGMGTEADPYLISNLQELLWISQTPDSWDMYFEQTADIDATATQFLDDSDDNNDGDPFNDPNDLTSNGNNEGFSPIGNSSTNFEGNYNGQGHRIDGLFIYRPTTDYVGFVGFSNGFSDTISELGITNCYIIGKDEVGSLVGSSQHNIIRCYATGTVDGVSYVGGLVGESLGNIENSFSRATVTGLALVGGSVGESLGIIENSYATGTVTGLSSLRGFVGFSVSGSEYYDCFWDTQTSGQSSDGGDAVGKTTTEMQQQTTFTNWDFSTVWKIDGINNDGYPYLQWQQFDPEVTTLAVSDLTATSVTVNGTIDNLGNPQATEYGVQLAENVDFTDQVTIVLGEPLTTGDFIAGFDELDQNTTYYVRAFVKDAFDVVHYGETVEFTTLIDITAPTPSLQNVPAVVDGPFTLELVFDEEIKDLSPSAITVAPDENGLNMATLGALVTVTEGFSYTIEVTPTIEGELRFFNENVGMARDLAGNNSNVLEEVTVIYDISAPELQSITLSSNNAASSSFAKAGDEVYLDFESNEPILDAIGNIHSTVVTFFNVEDNLWRGMLPITENMHEGNVSFELFVTDIYNNGVFVENTLDGSSVIVDITAPTAACQPMTITLDDSGNAVISAEDIDNGSFDANAIANRSIDVAAFTCEDLGENEVNLTVTDVAGNSSSCSSTVNIQAANGIGCEIPELDTDNFLIQIVPNSCEENADGALTIATMNIELEYVVNIEGIETLELNTTQGFSKSIENLSAGSYNICFTIAGFPQTEVCTTAVITEPEPLLVTSSFNTESGALELGLSGSNAYTITLNDKDFDVTGDSFSTVLSDTLTNLRVSTGFDCQGVYEEEFIVSEEILYGPNPTDGILNIYVPGTDTQVKIAVHNFSGNMVLLTDYEITATRMLELDLRVISSGTYMVTIKGETMEEAIKVIRL
ncbi:T9SS type A sorting domain-containing protein [Flagellimonas sp. CMM7]|uniref:T9SS type A sorting domain-containing protein n=1 Tax=Flagellimonas sp. CMM7 TaxID=2654676 RepID=UPI0013D303FC|nr:T9SS type A sorting domain-containing protein [Flagellimonas sp. CMM7]UII79313.1 T9SS type A sorting domain-containing protein [Flagellimonas sp. CMM7]